jgi:hypothetical protein
MPPPLPAMPMHALESLGKQQLQALELIRMELELMRRGIERERRD